MTGLQQSSDQFLTEAVLYEYFRLHTYPEETADKMLPMAVLFFSDHAERYKTFRYQILQNGPEYRGF